MLPLQLRQPVPQDLGILILIKRHNARRRSVTAAVPAPGDPLDGGVRQIVIRVHAHHQLRFRRFDGGIVGRVQPAVGLTDVLNREILLLRHPFRRQSPGPIAGAVVHDQPQEVPAGLPFQALVALGKELYSVVCRCKNRDKRFLHAAPSRLTAAI